MHAHFFDPGHNGLSDIRVNIIDKTNKENPTQREAFWAYKLDTFVPKGLNVRETLKIIKNLKLFTSDLCIYIYTLRPTILVL